MGCKTRGASRTGFGYGKANRVFVGTCAELNSQSSPPTANLSMFQPGCGHGLAAGNRHSTLTTASTLDLG
jgi:hypothetical protein